MSSKRSSVKAAKIALTGAFAVGALVFIASDGLYKFGLSRSGVNRKPFERLSDPEVNGRYKDRDSLREADDWFMSSHPEEIRLVGSSGDRLHAEYIPNPAQTHKWLICIHGWTSCPRNVAIYGKEFYQKGYNVLFPYMRGHRRSESDYVTLGLKDCFDVVDWIDYVTLMDPESQIVLIGTSMGGATTMLVTGERLPNNVKCAISDAGFTSAEDEVSSQLKTRLHIPSAPIINVLNAMSMLHDGTDLKKCRPVDAVARSVTPTAFIHGAEDPFVLPYMLDEVYEACSAPKARLLVPDAGHSLSSEVHPEIYWPFVWDFVDKYVE